SQCLMSCVCHLRSAARKSPILVCCAKTVVRSALTSKRVVSLVSIDYAQASRASLALLSICLAPPVDLVVGADELSLISYLGPRAMHNLFQGGNVTSGTSALQPVEGRSKGGDYVGNGIGKSGGVPDGGVPGGSVPDRGGGNGSGEDKGNGGGDAVLNRIPSAL
ncbi:hypothetical protein Tco_0808800, partial [Tanacetum coccineum]